MWNSFCVSVDMCLISCLIVVKVYFVVGLKFIVIYGIIKDGGCICGKCDCSYKGKYFIVKYFLNGVFSVIFDFDLIKKVLCEFLEVNFVMFLEGLIVVDIDGLIGKVVFDWFMILIIIVVKMSWGWYVYFISEFFGGMIKVK